MKAGCPRPAAGGCATSFATSQAGSSRLRAHRQQSWTPSAPPQPRFLHVRRSTARGDDGGEHSSGGMVPDKLPVVGADTDWREFRARLVASSRSGAQHGVPVTEPTSELRATAQPSETADLPTDSSPRWAHSLPRPEKGCLLCAHPMMFTSSQTYFHQAVILVLEHTEQGSYGVILNRPSKYKLSELNLTHPLPEFGDSQLFVGGDVGGGEITLLHTRPGLEGSLEVVRGVHVGGIAAARAAVAAGRAEPSEFRFFAKYSGWGPGQLESECRRGVWFTVAAAPGVIMTEPEAADGSDAWHDVLRLMGGDYARLSANVRSSEARKRRAFGGGQADTAEEGAEAPPPGAASGGEESV